MEKFMIKGFLVGLVIVAFGLITYLAIHLGTFKEVVIKEDVKPEIYLLYTEHRGSYYLISEKITAVEAAAKAAGLDCARTFGLYLDDPAQVDEDRLQSQGGCISAKPFPPTLAQFKLKTIAAHRYIIGSFRGSPAIGPWKVYPAVKNYMTAKRLHENGPVMEIYEVDDDHSEILTEYLFPIPDAQP
jgi:hypothetical protein